MRQRTFGGIFHRITRWRSLSVVLLARHEPPDLQDLVQQVFFLAVGQRLHRAIGRDAGEAKPGNVGRGIHLSDTVARCGPARHGLGRADDRDIFHKKARKVRRSQSDCVGELTGV